MSVIIAIFQALLQAVSWILPISESFHSSLFHEFSARLSGANASITGFVHIGIALGIVLALYKLFITLAKELIGSVVEVVTNIASKKKTKSRQRDIKPARSFMLMSLLSLAPMVFLLIPVGKGRVLYDLLRMTQHNGSLVEDALLLGVTGALVFFASRKLDKATSNKNITLPMALAVGFANILLVSLSGLSFVFGIFAILLLMGASKKLSYRYAMVLSAPVLLVMGVVEAATAITHEGVVAAIVAVVVACAVSFFLTNMLRALINKNNIKYIAYYDFAAAIIALIIGLIMLIIK